jgi:hypothetical protein
MSSNKSVSARFDTAVVLTATLSVGTTGSGKGTVAAIGYIYCGDTVNHQYFACTHTFSLATGTPTIILTAQSATTTSTFAGWTGCDSTNGTQCIVTMSSNKSVTARFDTVVVPTTSTTTLSVSLAGAGRGWVSATSGAYISCGTYANGTYYNTCTQTYNISTSTPTVILSASPYYYASSTFAGWTGCDSTNVTQCIITMSSNKSVTARFDTVPPVVTASVHVLSPNDADTFMVGSTQTIRWESTGVERVYINWTQDRDGDGFYEMVFGLFGSMPQSPTGSLSWTIPANIFSLSSSSTLNKILISGSTGSGVVTDISDAPFSIVATTTVVVPTADGQTFTKGETWTFRTMPVAGAQSYLIAFYKAGSGWFYENYAHDRRMSSDGSWTIAPSHPFYNSFIAGEDVRVGFAPYFGNRYGEAYFATVHIAGPNPLTSGNSVLTATISGESGLSNPGGRIISTDGAVTCPTVCAQVYQTGSTVALEAVPNSGYRFLEWIGGGCTGSNTSPTCSVLMNQSKTMTALFMKAPTISVTLPSTGQVVHVEDTIRLAWTTTGVVSNSEYARLCQTTNVSTCTPMVSIGTYPQSSNSFTSSLAISDALAVAPGTWMVNIIDANNMQTMGFSAPFTMLAKVASSGSTNSYTASSLEAIRQTLINLQQMISGLYQ